MADKKRWLWGAVVVAVLGLGAWLLYRLFSRKRRGEVSRRCANRRALRRALATESRFWPNTMAVRYQGTAPEERLTNQHEVVVLEIFFSLEDPSRAQAIQYLRRFLQPEEFTLNKQQTCATVACIPPALSMLLTRGEREDIPLSQGFHLLDPQDVQRYHPLPHGLTITECFPAASMSQLPASGQTPMQLQTIQSWKDELEADEDQVFPVKNTGMAAILLPPRGLTHPSPGSALSGAWTRQDWEGAALTQRPGVVVTIPTFFNTPSLLHDQLSAAFVERLFVLVPKQVVHFVAQVAPDVYSKAEEEGWAFLPVPIRHLLPATWKRTLADQMSEGVLDLSIWQEVLAQRESKHAPPAALYISVFSQPHSQLWCLLDHHIPAFWASSYFLGTVPSVFQDEKRMGKEMDLLAAHGVTCVQASGDQGAYPLANNTDTENLPLDVRVPSIARPLCCGSSVLMVGGTPFRQSPDLSSGKKEMLVRGKKENAWPEQRMASAGGFLSGHTTTPWRQRLVDPFLRHAQDHGSLFFLDKHQTVQALSDVKLPGTSRNTPDVTFVGQAIFFTKDPHVPIFPVVGTSVAAPALAALLATAAQFQPLPRLVQRLYEDTELRSRLVQRNVLEFTNAMKGGFPGFQTVSDPAIPWDPVQGLGVVDTAQLSVLFTLQ